MDVWRAGRGRELSGDVRALAGLVVLGGDMDAVDSTGFPHLTAVQSLMIEAAGAELPVLGLCLGAQLGALAFGGEVSRRAGGPCIGWRPVRAVGDDPVTAGLPCDAKLFHWHRDAFTPPPGSTPILDDCGAFRLGSVRGLQAHPEVTTDMVREWAQDPAAAEELSAAGVDVDAALAASVDLVRHGRAVLDAWAVEVAQSRR
jgi:GMP synthase (glutamine-hydrolysing)